MTRKTEEQSCLEGKYQNKSVVCISFKKDDTTHMLVDNLEFAKSYCKKYPIYDWESWSIQHKTKEDEIDF